MAIWAVAFAALTLSGCASGGGSSTSAAGSASVPDTPATSSASSPLACPNSEGGACRGKLEARTTFTTQVFSPTITYQVPTRGWRNFEDTSGNFLLVPPGSGLPGVNAGTSDYIGTYTSVAPARLTNPKGCVIRALPGHWTPAKMASYYRQLRDLKTTRPAPITIGGLNGVMVDMRTKPGSKLEECTGGGQRFALGGEWAGLSPSSFDHAVLPGMTIRMIMLNYAGNVLLVEIDDIDKAPARLPELTAVARHMQFPS